MALSFRQLSGCLLFLFFGVVLQSQKPLLHFDGSQEIPFFWQGEDLQIEVDPAGFIGAAWSKTSAEAGLLLSPQIAPLNAPFTILFWVQPEQVGQLNTLMEQPLPDSSQVFSLKVQDHVFGLFDSFRQLALANYPIDTFVQNWYQVGFVFDGSQHRLYLQGRAKFSSSEFPELFLQQAAPRELTLLKGFQGKIDEVRYFDQALDPLAIRTQWQEDLQKRTQHLTRADNNFDAAPTAFPAATAGRPNQLAYQLSVPQTSIELEFWDYNHFDKDWVTIYRNAENRKTHSILLPKKKNRRSLQIDFPTEATVQHLIFYAEDMGLLPSENTVAFRIKGSTEVHQIAIDRQQNAVLELRLGPANTPQLKRLPPVTTFNTQPTLQLRCKKERDQGDLIYLQLSGEDKPQCLPLYTHNTTIELPLKYNQEQQLSIHGFLLGQDGTATIEISLWDQQNELVHQELELHTHQYQLPIRHQAGKVRSFPKATIVLDRCPPEARPDFIELSISEDIKEDGDLISLYLEQETL
ncbi:MAG: hypothetical protein KDC44_15910, partial [Phaeodactylibacter sp.]|nr:hypothetical protein [Phaeodactylibacter sp.]